MTLMRRGESASSWVSVANDPIKIFFIVQLFAIIVLQKFGLPTGVGPTELSLPIMLVSLAALMTTGTGVRVETVRVILLAAFWVSAALSQVISGRAFSPSAIILLFAIYLTACVSLDISRSTYLACLKAFVALMLAFLVVVVLQHLMQLVWGRQSWPNLNEIVPKEFLFPGYNYVQALSWGSKYFKPHAFLFLEVSILSQFAALAFVIELTYFRRILPLAGLAMLLLLCFAGTGLLILMICMPVLLAKAERRVWLLAIVGGAILVAVAIGSGWFAQIENRIFEFEQFGSSGYYRFTVPINVALDLLSDPDSIFSGYGAGNTPTQDAAVYLPLVKLYYEYGLAPAFIFLIFLLYSMLQYSTSKRVTFAFFVFFMICGGGLSTPVYALMIVLFCTMFRVRPDQPRVESVERPVVGLRRAPPQILQEIQLPRRTTGGKFEPMPVATLKASVIIPTYNEARHIKGVLDRVLQGADTSILEVIVVDGRSEDRTREIVEAYAAGDKRVRLIDNPKRLQAAGVNLAATVAHPEATAFIRLDAHSDYSPDFVRHLLDALAVTNAESVVVRLRTVGEGCFQRAVAVVSNSLFGTGGAIHRVGGKSGYVDHGHHAAFLRSAYERIGGYDETFAAAEDAEFDQRLRDVGGKIWFAADLEVDYFPRPTVQTLAKQYFRNGIGRAQTVLKHRGKIRLRQVIPPVFLVSMVLALGVAFFARFALIIPLGYFGACALAGVAFAIRRRDPCLLAAAYALPAMHLPWAVGFLKTVFIPPAVKP